MEKRIHIYFKENRKITFKLYIYKFQRDKLEKHWNRLLRNGLVRAQIRKL